MAKPGRNQPCPCGSGVKYKKCCLPGKQAAGADTASAEPVPEAAPFDLGAGLETLEGLYPHVDIALDADGGEVVVFDFQHDDELKLEVKRLAGRRFDWRARLWIVPVRPGLAGDVASILRRHSWLRPSEDLSRWLDGERRWAAEVSVVEDEGRGWFAAGTCAGSAPEELQRRATVRGRWLLLPLDRPSADLLVRLAGAELDDPARRCAEALRAGDPVPAAVLELGADEGGELRLELRVLWGFSLAHAFGELPHMQAGEWREDEVTFDIQAERLAVPADPALLDELDAFLDEWLELAVAEEAGAALVRMREERARADEVVALSAAADAELDVPGLGGTLHPFQRAGVRYALEQRRTFIADEQGLGKTIQALAAIHADGAYPAAVVCPASMKLVWEREARSWLPGRDVAVVHGRSGEGWTRAGAGGADVVVLNYEIAEAHLERLTGRELRAVVFDESQYCKDPRRKRTKAAIELSRGADPEALRLALTGTPILNRPSELPSQLRLLDRLGDFGSGARVSRRFRGQEGLERLHWHLRAHCYVRRLKADVLPQLPPKGMATVPVELDNEREYRLAEEDVVAWLQAQPLDLRTLEARVASALRAEQLVRLGYLRKLAARGKIASALAWIEDFLSSGESLVVFAHHREVQTALCRRFPDAAHLLGSDDAGERRDAVDAFQDSDGPPLIVCSMQVASQGLTLTRASNVAFLELDWTPARHDQAEDRCHRIGQESAVTAWYLLAPDTIDESMADVLERKRGVIGAVTDGRAIEDQGMLAAVVQELRAKGAGERLAAA
ncbi:MAG: SNF2-related protein [Solirubrobacteraceae bacterium]